MNLFAVISILLLLLSGLSYADSSGTTSLGTTGEKITLVLPRKPDNFLAKWLNMIYTEAFKRLNMEFVYKYTLWLHKKVTLQVIKDLRSLWI